jgi:hypothetical protein
MMSLWQFRLNNDESVAIPFSTFVGEQMDPLVVDNERLAKQGRVGKFIARHRAASLCFAAAMFVVGCATLLFLSGSYFFGSMRLIAAGVSYRFGEAELPHDSVKPISTEYHALLVYNELAGAPRRKLTPADVVRGYAEWRVTLNERTHNFTWRAAKQLARTTLGNDTCLCYLQLGLAYNVVACPVDESDVELMYEPEIESDSHRVANVTVGIRSKLYKMLYAARVFIDASQTPPRITPPPQVPFVSAASGTVRYITEDGSLRRAVLADPLYPCIKECAQYFE